MDIISTFEGEDYFGRARLVSFRDLLSRSSTSIRMAEAGVTAAGRRAVAAAAAGAALCLVVVLAIVGSQPGPGRSELALAASPGPAAAKSTGEAVAKAGTGATVASASPIPEAALPGSGEFNRAVGIPEAPLPGSGAVAKAATGATVASAGVSSGASVSGAVGAEAVKIPGEASPGAAAVAPKAGAATPAAGSEPQQDSDSYAAVEARASLEAKAAKEESKEVRELKAELTHLKGSRLAQAAIPKPPGGQAAHGAVAPAATTRGGGARTHKLNGVTDMRNGGSKAEGAGYWDAEHKDDDWQPVADVVKGMKTEEAFNKRLLGSRQQNVLTAGDDLFSDDASSEGALVKASNLAAASNQEQPEFKNDDSFLAPPAQITPNHRLPLETQDAGWETWLGGKVGALWKGNSR